MYAARAADEAAGIGPDDVDVARLRVTDAGNEVIHMAETGLCADGEREKLLADSATEIRGSLPVNTDGGLIANCEPIGASGLRQMHEPVRQLRGEAGVRQVPGNPWVGLALPPLPGQRPRPAHCPLPELHPRPFPAHRAGPSGRPYRRAATASGFPRLQYSSPKPHPHNIIGGPTPITCPNRANLTQNSGCAGSSQASPSSSASRRRIARKSWFECDSASARQARRA